MDISKKESFRITRMLAAYVGMNVSTYRTDAGVVPYSSLIHEILIAPFLT